MRLALNLKFDGVYIPSFNKKINFTDNKKVKYFRIIGSAHNLSEIRIKEKQGVQLIFISPLFKNQKKKRFLDSIKFNSLTLKTNLKTVALGGINAKNIIRLKQIKSYGFASISYFEAEHKFNNYILNDEQ